MAPWNTDQPDLAKRNYRRLRNRGPAVRKPPRSPAEWGNKYDGGALLNNSKGLTKEKTTLPVYHFESRIKDGTTIQVSTEDCLRCNDTGERR